jgi:hypothetical protein
VTDPERTTLVQPQTATLVTRALDCLTTWKRAFYGEPAARRDASLVVTEESRAMDNPQVLRVYLAAIPFINGDAWEVVR